MLRNHEDPKSDFESSWFPLGTIPCTRRKVVKSQETIRVLTIAIGTSKMHPNGHRVLSSRGDDRALKRDTGSRARPDMSPCYDREETEWRYDHGRSAASDGRTSPPLSIPEL